MKEWQITQHFQEADELVLFYATSHKTKHEEIIMKRWHQEMHIALREWKKYHQSHVENNKSRNRIGVSAYVIDCERYEQIGRFRKKDAWDCGNPQCGLCHSDKFPKREKSYQEVKSELKMKEQITQHFQETGDL